MLFMWAEVIVFRKREGDENPKHASRENQPQPISLH